MLTLEEIYKKHIGGRGHGDKGTAHSYIPIYQELLDPFRHQSTVVEIGLSFGHSLLMWEEYFINSTVVGIDITDKEISPLLQDHKIFIRDSTNELEIRKTFSNVEFSVVLDDGSHRLKDQLKTYSVFKHLLADKFIYIIEDVADIDKVASSFLNMDPTKDIQIIDRRHIKNRFDDVLVVIRSKYV